jgi:hypothetical protein
VHTSVGGWAQLRRLTTMGGFAPRTYRSKKVEWVGVDGFTVEVVPDPRAGERGVKPHSRLTHKRQSRVNQADDALGNITMKKGEHRFVFDIRSVSSSGYGIRVGVASTDGRERFGIRLSDGRSVRVPEANQDLGEAPVMLAERVAGALDRAVSRRVEVIVNMALHTVHYSVDGATAVDSGVLPDDYPDELVPWAQMFYKHDEVTISHYRTARLPQRSTPRSASSRREVPPPAKKPPYEAGPWSP